MRRIEKNLKEYEKALAGYDKRKHPAACLLKISRDELATLVISLTKHIINKEKKGFLWIRRWRKFPIR